MLNRSKYKWFLLLVILMPIAGWSQIAIQPSGSNFQKLETICSFDVTNNYTDELRAFVSIDLDEQGSKVLSVQVAEVVLKPGLNHLNLSTPSSKISFYNTVPSNFLKLNDKLADGEYNACYSILATKPINVQANQCVPFTVRNGTALLLVSPFNGESVCAERPTFQWQNPAPLAADAKVRIVLSEIQEGQNATEAIYRNIPVFSIPEAGGNTLSLPSFVDSLREGRSYAWQVVVYNNQGIIAKSDIWTFKKDCDNAGAKKSELDSYRQLKAEPDANYYLVKNFIRFSFSNSYGAEKLDYTIVDAQSNKVISYYPVVVMHPGLNNVQIDVDDCRGLKKGHIYIVSAKNVNSTVLQMKFRYDEK